MTSLQRLVGDPTMPPRSFSEIPRLIRLVSSGSETIRKTTDRPPPGAGTVGSAVGSESRVSVSWGGEVVTTISPPSKEVERESSGRSEKEVPSERVWEGSKGSRSEVSASSVGIAMIVSRVVERKPSTIGERIREVSPERGPVVTPEMGTR